MFAEFDESMFPTIKVILHEGPNNDTDYDSFIHKWLELYDNQKDFTFLFDTTNMKNPSFKYALKMPFFIKTLKKREYQYLQKSIILINDNKIMFMLDFIFAVQKPVAPVFIYNINNGNHDNIDDIMNDESTLFIDNN